MRRRGDGTEVWDEEMQAGERTQLGENKKKKKKKKEMSDPRKCAEMSQERERRRRRWGVRGSVIPRCQGDNFLNSGPSSHSNTKRSLPS